MTDGMTQDPVQRDAMILRGIEDMRTRKARLYERARRDVNTFATLFKNEEGYSLKQAGIHREFQSFFSAYKRGMIWAPVEHGKCQPPWSTVQLSDGQYKQIVDVKEGDKVASWDGDKMTSATAGQPFCDGMQRVMRIHTQHGRMIDVTDEHPLMTWHGWKRAGELRVNDRIAVPYGRNYGNIAIDNDIAWLLGLLVGDGGLSIKERINVTIADADIVDSVKHVAGKYGWHLRTQRGQKYGYSLSGPVHRGKMGRRRRPVNYLTRDGWLDQCTSYYKRVPKVIFTADSDTIKAFLAGYFDADGSAGDYRGPMIEYYSVSRELLADVQELLTRLGVQSILRQKRGKYNGRIHLSWRLSITSDSKKLASMLPSKTAKLDVIHSYIERNHSTYDCLTHDAFYDLGVTEHRLRMQYNMRLSHYKSITRAWLIKAANVVGNEEVERLANRPFWWDRIDRIEDMGMWPVYGLPVEKTHCYVSSGILSHNSIQLAIRILWELGRQPWLKIFLASSSEKLGKKILSMMKNNIALNEDLHRTFPHLTRDNFETWDKTAIQIKGARGTKKDNTIEAIGVLGQFIGSRADVLVLDDIVDLKNSTSPTQRMKIVDWHDSIATGRLTRYAREWIIGTPWNKYDFYHIMEERGVELRKYEVETNGRFIWPEQWDMERLQDRKKIMTAWRFYQQYYMMDASPDESPFSYDAMELCSVQAERFRNKDSIPDGWQCITGVDIGIETKKDSDRTVFCTLATDGTKKLILDIRGGKWGLSDKQNIAEAIHRQYGGLFVVESNAAQKLMVEMLKKYTRVTVISSNTQRGTKVSDSWGIPAMAIDIENGRWQIPAKPQAPMEVKQWMDECIMYNPQSHTGDSLMACYLAYSGIERMMGRGVTVRTATSE